MTNRSGDIGTWTAERVVQYLHTNGWPHAERTALHGRHDRGDITGTPGICWEVKGGHAAESASDGQIAKWLTDTERERLAARADVGVLVVKRKGIGAANTGAWWAVVWVDALVLSDTDMWVWPPAPRFPARLYLADVCRLLCVGGFGTPPAAHVVAS